MLRSHRHGALELSWPEFGSRSVRTALALLLAVAMGHGVLHRHGALVPECGSAQCQADAQGQPQIPGNGKPLNSGADAPCQTCILIAGLDLPVVSATIAVPELSVVALVVGDEASPPSHVSWSHRLLRGPPIAC